MAADNLLAQPPQDYEYVLARCGVRLQHKVILIPAERLFVTLSLADTPRPGGILWLNEICATLIVYSSIPTSR